MTQIFSSLSCLSNSNNNSLKNKIQYQSKLSDGKSLVYQASLEGNSDKIAIKFYPQESETFKNEARFTTLSHSHIIAPKLSNTEEMEIPEMGTKLVSYTISEFAQNGDFFFHFVENRISVDEKVIRTYFHQLIDALEYLHSREVHHLDLKMENLMLDDKFGLKVIDFDLSHKFGDKHVISSGTSGYRAPEIYHRCCTNPNSADIYSAGVILFILKNGKNLPYCEGKLIQGMNFFKVMQEDPEQFFSVHRQILNAADDFWSPEFKELYIGMTKADFVQRWTLKEVKESKWFNGEIYTPEEMGEIMKKLISV